MKKISRFFLAVGIFGVFALLSSEAKSGPSIYESKIDALYGRFVDAASGTTDGEWIRNEPWMGSGTIEVTGTGTWVIQIRGSNQQNKPANTFDGSQLGKDIITAGFYGLSFKSRWVKAHVSSYTSGTPSADFVIGRAGTTPYMWVGSDGTLFTQAGGASGALATEATLALLEGKDFATETTLAVVAALDFASETTLGLLNGKDFATQTTLALLEGKDFATQTTLALLEGKDFATETTLAIIAALDFASETTLALLEGKDFATQTTLALLEGKDFATQTTLAANNILLGTIDTDTGAMVISLASLDSKATADPSTATLQSDLNALTIIIDAVLDLMKIALDNILLDTTAIELNTDSPTVFASATFSVGTAAVELLPVDLNRRSGLIRNADSNTVLYVGPTSGVTTANGIAINTAGASGNNGNGGTITYSHTAAVWGIVASGTADTRTQSESD